MSKYYQGKEHIDDFYKKIGENISTVRKSTGLTQESFAEMIGISRVALNCIELGKQRLSVYHYAVICQMMGVQLEAVSTEALPPSKIVRKTKLYRKIEDYKKSVLSSGLTDQQQQGVEMVFMGIFDILLNA